MRISFASSYLSIHSFPEIDLPDFSLITGPNGAGKSHLLQALQNGSMRADCAPNQGPQNQTEIRLFDWTSLVPQETGVFASETFRNEMTEAFNHFSTQMRGNNAHLNPLRNLLRAHALPGNFIQNPIFAITMSEQEVIGLVGNDKAPNFLAALENARQQGEASLLASMPEEMRDRVKRAATNSHRTILELDQQDFFATNVPSWGQVTIFQQSFARLFVAYRDAKLANQMSQFLASKGEEAPPHTTDEEFTQENGLPPWEFVNNTLQSAGLDFRINKPAPNQNSPFQPELTKLSSDVRVPFANLSSGEKILMSFAFCVYYSQDRRQIAAHPKVILLDEVDAPLHPSMSKNLIDTIRKTLVDNFKIKVIATTHSPSTVALSPDDSVFVMKPGVPGLHKTSRAEALNILTVGVPTLAISFEGRRQVFVESPSDAKAYDAIYKILKPKLSSERSLEFIATGAKSNTGAERNTGCEVVKRIVSSLSDAGNNSVFGLLDWDNHHQQTDRIAVLGQGTRNGIENCVFDPLAILLAICRDASAYKTMVGIPNEITFMGMAQLDDLSLIQASINKLTEKVLGAPAEKLVEITYCGGVKLRVDERYLLLDDHALEAAVMGAFPFLNALSKKQAGILLQHVITTVFTDVPAAIPVEMRDVMLDLLERPSH